GVDVGGLAGGDVDADGPVVAAPAAEPRRAGVSAAEGFPRRHRVPESDAGAGDELVAGVEVFLEVFGVEAGAAGGRVGEGEAGAVGGADGVGCDDAVDVGLADGAGGVLEIEGGAAAAGRGGGDSAHVGERAVGLARQPALDGEQGLVGGGVGEGDAGPGPACDAGGDWGGIGGREGAAADRQHSRRTLALVINGSDAVEVVGVRLDGGVR